MAKGTGIYGNFNGKIGNTVGFKIAQSRNRQNQGVRIYQPSVGNPKTAAQAEQRARVAAVQGTYTMLRTIIDRGNERQPYGYASRVAWLRQAYRSEIFPWFPKGARITAPVICPLTFGSLPELDWYATEDYIVLNAPGIPADEHLEDIGGVSYWLEHYNTFLRDGDQLTFVTLTHNGSKTDIDIFSFPARTAKTHDGALEAGSRRRPPARRRAGPRALCARGSYAAGKRTIQRAAALPSGARDVRREL